MISNAFARLLGMQRSAPARDRLIELRSQHGLSEDDPVWALVAVVEEFCMQLHAATPQMPSSTPTPPEISSLPTWRVAVLASAAAALQTLLLAATFVAGARAGNTKHLVAEALSLPAGWVIGVLLAPLFTSVMGLGWRARRIEPAIGWSLTVGGAAATLALFVALAWTI